MLKVKVIKTGPQGTIESLRLEVNRGVILVSGAKIEDGRHNLIEFLFALEPLPPTNPSARFQAVDHLIITNWKGCSNQLSTRF